MVKEHSKESWKAKVKLNEHMHAVKFNVDTGADVTVIPPNIYHQIYTTKYIPPNIYHRSVPKPSLKVCIRIRIHTQ